MTYRPVSVLFLFCLVLSAPGCALTSKADAISPRYFSPEPTRDLRSDKAPTPYQLRLGDVSAAAHLDDRIAYRVSSSEMGFYEDRRWTENPEAYLRRALQRDLFQERGLARVIAGAAPILDVELNAFEEVREPPSRARVSLTFVLRDDSRALLERTINLERPFQLASGADSAQAIASTLTATLDDAVRQLDDAVLTQLAATNAATQGTQGRAPLPGAP